MKRILLIIAIAAGAVPASAVETYVGAGGAVMLPQGGSRMHRVGGGMLRGGCGVNDDLAVEGEAAWLEDTCGLAVQGLWHWQGAELYNRFFGYSRFDPFFTFGARGWFGRQPGQLGPKLGVGAFYHLSDNWSLRADADATLGLDTKTEADYSISIGVQYAF